MSEDILSFQLIAQGIPLFVGKKILPYARHTGVMYFGNGLLVTKCLRIQLKNGCLLSPYCLLCIEWFIP